VHCALSSDKRDEETVPSGEAFRLGLPFWFTCMDTPLPYRAFNARDPGGWTACAQGTVKRY